MKKVFAGIGIFIGLIVLAFGMELGGLQWDKFFKPRRENLRRQVFEQSRSYNAGKEQDLMDYYGQYMLADDEDKKIIQQTIRLTYADYDESMFKSTELKSFLKEMKYGKEW